jgi:hypothetical protein
MARGRVKPQRAIQSASRLLYNQKGTHNDERRPRRIDNIIHHHVRIRYRNRKVSSSRQGITKVRREFDQSNGITRDCQHPVSKAVDGVFAHASSLLAYALV